MFLPPHNDLPHPLRYGYVIHSEQRTLFKIELDSMRYTKSVDLVRFGCVPQDVAFIHLGKRLKYSYIQLKGINSHSYFWTFTFFKFYMVQNSENRILDLPISTLF